jgi:hypothetical protein
VIFKAFIGFILIRKNGAVLRLSFLVRRVFMLLTKTRGMKKDLN